MKLEDVYTELLEKYAENSCSESERYLVEQWLNNDTFEETITPFSSENEKDDLQKEIWASISSEIQNRNKRPSIGRFFQYSISAAVILILITVTFSSKSLFKEKVENPMQIVEVCDELTFIPIKNNAEILFVSETAGENKLSQKIFCLEGNTYLAIKIKFDSVEELLVVNEKDIQSLPPYLNSYITNQIKG